MRKIPFDWTTGYDLDISAYEIEYREDKIELMIPVFGASKKDIKINIIGGEKVLNGWPTK